MITAAPLLTQQTHNDVQRRYEAKRHLTRLLYLRGWDKRSIIELYRVIDWMLRLPVELAKRLRHEVADWEREANMRYITSIEELGRAEGKREGRQEGMLLGQVKGRADLLVELLSKRFNCGRREVRNRMHGATDEQLERWSSRLFDASSLDEVFRLD